MEARDAGIETVYQNLALSPALSIADNMFLGREIRKPGRSGKWFRMLDRPAMAKVARDKLSELGLMTIQNIDQAVETLSGGQRQGVAVARAAAFGSKVVIMDEPTAALGVKESRRVLELILDVKKRGMPIVLISHNMPHVFEVADRIHIHRLGRRLCVIDPKEYHDVGRRGVHDRRQEAAGRGACRLIRFRKRVPRFRRNLCSEGQQAGRANRASCLAAAMMQRAVSAFNRLILRRVSDSIAIGR